LWLLADVSEHRDGIHRRTGSSRDPQRCDGQHKFPPVARRGRFGDGIEVGPVEQVDALNGQREVVHGRRREIARWLGPWPINDGMAGFDNSIIPWLKKRDIAILGWETPDYAPHPPSPNSSVSMSIHLKT
jgi:hypothetical protein